MDFTVVGGLGIVLLLILLFLGLPIGITFLLVGLGGITYLLGPVAAISLLGETLYSAISNPAVLVIPLFMLMGAFGTEGGFAKRTYDAMHIISARVPGSLAVATSFGSALFGAVSGSTLASTVVFGKMAYPEMKKAGYDRPFALASIATAGTIACMIPPSSMFVLFAIFTNLSIGKLFMAGVLPGILLAIVFAVYIIFRAKYSPAIAPAAEFEKDVTLKTRLKAIKGLWEIGILGFIIIGGLYTGILTPVGAGACGVLVAFLIGFFRGPLRKIPAILTSLRETANACAMLLFLIVGAIYFSRFLTISRLPMELSSFLQSWEVHSNFVLAAIFVLWIFLGMIMTQVAVFVLTLPVLFPVVVALGYDPIWFCVVAMVFNEIAAISPPVGLNVFALSGIVGDGTSIEEIFKSVWPFILCCLFVVILLFFMPWLATWLPSRM